MMVLPVALWPVGIGLAIGILAAISTGRLIASQLFDVRPWDPQILSGATLILVLAALVSATIPARRATQADPMVALKTVRADLGSNPSTAATAMWLVQTAWMSQSRKSSSTVSQFATDYSQHIATLSGRWDSRSAPAGPSHRRNSSNRSA
jgi:hypothetical protein